MNVRRSNPVVFVALVSVLAVAVSAAAAQDRAQYTMRFQATWSAATHPQNLPARPHFSPLIGGVHDSSVVFWQEGANASNGIEAMAELGGTVPLSLEVEDTIAAGQASQVILGNGISRSPGSTSLTFEVTRRFPLVTLVTMLAPSPDWFVGVSGLSLFENGDWVQRKVVTLYTWDAGTDSGSEYTSPNRDTRPQDVIRLLDTAPLANGVPVGTFTFIRSDAPAPTPLVLSDGRFEVEVLWQDFMGSRGSGRPVQLTGDTGYFWFFNESNVEVVVKVLDGCSVNGHFWVFAGGLTSVEVELRVEDTATGQAVVYSNALGDPFQPVQDTGAFATCP